MINLCLTEKEKDSLLKWFFANGKLVQDDNGNYHYCQFPNNTQISDKITDPDDKLAKIFIKAMDSLTVTALYTLLEIDSRLNMETARKKELNK